MTDERREAIEERELIEAAWRKGRALRETSLDLAVFTRGWHERAAYDAALGGEREAQIELQARHAFADDDDGPTDAAIWSELSEAERDRYRAKARDAYDATLGGERDSKILGYIDESLNERDVPTHDEAGRKLSTSGRLNDYLATLGGEAERHEVRQGADSTGYGYRATCSCGWTATGASLDSVETAGDVHRVALKEKS